MRTVYGQNVKRMSISAFASNRGCSVQKKKKAKKKTEMKTSVCVYTCECVSFYEKEVCGTCHVTFVFDCRIPECCHARIPMPGT